jgi:Cupin-like domain
MKPYNVSAADWTEYNALFFLEHVLGHRFFRRLFARRERNLWASVDRHASAANGNGQPFRIVEHADPAEEPLYDPVRPEVFRGVARDWPCTRRWTFDFFAEQFGDKDVVITNNVGLVGNGQKTYEVLKLRDYIAQLRAGSLKYLKFSQMIHESSELQDDFNAEWLLKFHPRRAFKRLFFLFMGGKGTVTPIHTALPPTVFVQVYGTKKWTFFPTSDRLFLGVRPDRRSYYYTHANPHGPSDTDFPLLKHASPQELVLNAGDVVWFPALCWHQVENLTDSIGVAYKFSHIPSSFRASKMLTTLFFLATRPSIFHSAIMARITKKEYIFNSRQDY